MKKLKKDNIEKWFDQNDQLVKEIHYYNNGQKYIEIYYLNGKRHKTDGPAIQSWFENSQKEYEAYYLNDKRHKTDGPARQLWFENGQKCFEEYYLNGKQLTKNEFIIFSRKKKLKLFL